VTIPAGGYLLVVKNLTAFGWLYPSVPLPPERILGPYDGRLRNSGERVELSMPGDVDEFGTRYYIRIDRVNYSDGWHPEDCPGGIDLWPIEADGGGMSLSRINSNLYGNDVINWAAEEPSPGIGWTQLTYDDFESGWGNYTDGGADCSLYTGAMHAHQGSSAADIQDDSGVSSSFYYTNGIDVDTAGYTEIKISFWFKAVSMESGEDFWVQYYDGSSWNTVVSYARGTDFNNNEFYEKDVYVNEGTYTFPTNMKIRFMCDASGDSDDVYIDEIRVSAK